MRFRTIIRCWLGLNVLILAVLAIGGGDPSTCAHPSIRTDGPVIW